MKKILFILFLFTSLCSCKHPNNKIEQEQRKRPKQLVDNKTIYGFLKDILEKDPATSYCNNIYDRNLLPFLQKEDSLAITKMDSIFTKEDIEFIFKQVKYNFFKLDQKYLPKENIIELDTVKAYSSNKNIRYDYWRNNMEKYGSTCSINLPLFSIDRKKAIVSFGVSCGTLCGHGGTYIFKKEGDKWILIVTLSEWVS